MLLLLDNILNNYISIMSCFVLFYIPILNKDKFFIILIFDLLLNKIPTITLLIFLIFLIDKFLYKIFLKNNITNIIVYIINLFIFLLLLYFINNYNFNILYYIKYLIPSITFNIFIYFLYTFAYKK